LADLLWSDVVEVSPAQAKQRLLEMLDDAELIATSWQEGSVSATHVEMAAETEARLSKIVVFLKNAFQSATAKRETLTRTSSGFFDNEREEATHSQHLVTLAAAVGFSHSIDVGDVVLTHPDGHSYRNIEGNSVVYPHNLASGTSQTFLFECEVAGSASNIGNALTLAAVTLSLETTLAGVTITDHALDEAGIDEESDERLHERNTNKWSGLGSAEGIDERHTLLALSSSPSIIHVAIDSTNPRGEGTFDVYIAGLDATASDDDVAKCQAVLRRHVFGRDNTVQTKKSPTVDVEIVGIVYFSGNFTQEDIEPFVNEALLAFVRSTPSGGFNFAPGPSNIIARNDIESVIREAVRGVTGANSKATVTLSSPSADLPIPQFGRPILATPLLVYQAITEGF